MPKRTNAFQQAILLLKKELAGTSATIQESVMLPNAVTGEEREVDILIEKQIVGMIIRIAVECTDRKRKADAPWVESMLAKHSDLPTHTLILASRNGFTNAAKTTATAKGIAFVNIESLPESLANTVVGKIKEVFLKRGIAILKNVEITIFNEVIEKKEIFKAFPDTEIVLDDGSAHGTLINIVKQIISMNQIKSAIFQNARPEHTDFRIDFPGPLFDNDTKIPLCVKNPILREILKLTLTGHLMIDLHTVSLDSAVIDNRAAAWGEVTISGKTGIILLNEDESKKMVQFNSTFSEQDLKNFRVTFVGTKELEEKSEHT